MIELYKVTKFSQIVAVALGIIIFGIGFWVGEQKEPDVVEIEKIVIKEKIVEVEKKTSKELEQLHDFIRILPKINSSEKIYVIAGSVGDGYMPLSYGLKENTEEDIEVVSRTGERIGVEGRKLSIRDTGFLTTRQTAYGNGIHPNGTYGVLFKAGDFETLYLYEFSTGDYRIIYTLDTEVEEDFFWRKDYAMNGVLTIDWLDEFTIKFHTIPLGSKLTSAEETTGQFLDGKRLMEENLNERVINIQNI